MINYSIIIPHYNIPDLLMRCLRSIPVREDIQVIVVDDCSPDASRYLDDYPELSRPYLEFYSTPKGGSAGRARNVGLEHAKGKWLVFADADDFFTDDLESCLEHYLDSNASIIYFNNRCVFSDNTSEECNRDSRAMLFQRFHETNDESIFRIECPTPWGKFIKRQLVHDHQVRFDETKWSNDIAFSVKTGIIAPSILIDSTVMYVVTQRNGSLTSEFCKTEQELICRLDVVFGVQEHIYKSGYKNILIGNDLLRLFLRKRDMYGCYLRKAIEMRINFFELFEKITDPCGLRDKTRIMLFSIWSIMTKGN